MKNGSSSRLEIGNEKFGRDEMSLRNGCLQTGRDVMVLYAFDKGNNQNKSFICVKHDGIQSRGTAFCAPTMKAEFPISIF